MVGFWLGPLTAQIQQGPNCFYQGTHLPVGAGKTGYRAITAVTGLVTKTLYINN
jgi:hypothetical protein